MSGGVIETEGSQEGEMNTYVGVNVYFKNNNLIMNGIVIVSTKNRINRLKDDRRGWRKVLHIMV